jgi:hypothetical protein
MEGIMKATPEDFISRDALRRATRRLLDRRFASWHAETPAPDNDEVRREIRKISASCARLLKLIAARRAGTKS